MTSVYIREQGAIVGRKGERLVVKKEGNVIEEFPMNQVDQVIVMGNVQISTQVLSTLVQKEIGVVFLSSYGKFKFDIGRNTKNASLRQRQLRLVTDGRLTLPVAQAIVDGKIHNQRVILQRQVNRLDGGGKQNRGATIWPRDRSLFNRSLAGMTQAQQAARQAANLDSLRGHEGDAARHYFGAIRSLLDKSWGFERREYHPPPDPFNALLSFAYSLVLKDVQAAIQITGLDLYLGFFHVTGRGQPSLALDLMEEWRPLLADALVLEMVNRGALMPNEFVWTNKQRRPVELGETGVQRVLAAYGSRLSTQLYHPLAGPGGQTTLYQALMLQARRMARLVAGKETAYEPMKAK